MNKIIFFILLLLLSEAVFQLCIWHARSHQQTAGVSSLAFDKSAFARRGMAALSVKEIRARLEAFKDADDINQKAGFVALLRRWTELDGRGAFDFANSLQDIDLRRQAIAIVGDTLSRSDPQFLAENILALRAGEVRTILVHELADAWSEADVNDALAWAQQLPGGPDKEDALITIRRALAIKDPVAASTMVAQLQESDSTRSLIATIAEHWATNDPAKAAEWAMTLPDSEQALALLKSTGIWAQRDPLAAADFVARMPVGDAQNESARTVVFSWATQDPPAAAAWVMQFPAGDLRNYSINVVATDWNMADPNKAFDWVTSLPDGTVQNVAYKSLAESIQYSVGDPSAQEKSMASILQSWSRNDPAAAKDWLAGWNADPDLKVQLQSSLSPE